MRLSSAITCFVFAMSLPTPGWFALASHPVKEDLDSVYKNLQHEKNLLNRLLRKSSSLLQTLAEIDKHLNSTCRDLNVAEANLKELEKRRKYLNKQLNKAGASLKECRSRLSVRLRALYKASEVGWLNFLFSGDSIFEVVERFGLLERLARKDADLIEETKRSRAMMAKLERELMEQQSRLEAQKEEVITRRENAERARTEQIQAIELVRREAGLHRKVVAELKRARSRLMKLVSALEGTDSMNLGFASWQGRLDAPVKSGNIDVPFGLRVDPRFKTKTVQQGVDILAEEGALVTSVYPGKVVYTKSFHGYGLLVIVDHGGGYYTLYAHLGRFLVNEGQKVRQGQQIGTLGRTGSLKGPYLYFEVREKGKAVDPEKWVRFQ